MGHKAEMARMRLLDMAKFKQATVVTVKVRPRAESEAIAKVEAMDRKDEMRDEARRLLKLRIEKRNRDDGGVYGDGDI